MARFCSSCGAQIADNAGFCGSCGKPQGATAAGATGTGAATGTAPAPVAAPATGLSDNVASLLCYSPIGLIADIIFLIVDPYKTNRTIKFNAIQSLLLAAACFAIWIGLNIVGFVLGAIGGPLGLLMIPIHLIVWLGMLVLWVFMMVRAYQGNAPVLPVIGPIAQKNAAIGTF